MLFFHLLFFVVQAILESNFSVNLMDRLDLSIPVATVGTSTNARLTFGPEEVKNGTACSTSVLVPGPADTGTQCGKISRQGPKNQISFV